MRTAIRRAMVFLLRSSPNRRNGLPYQASIEFMWLISALFAALEPYTKLRVDKLPSGSRVRCKFRARGVVGSSRQNEQCNGFRVQNRFRTRSEILCLAEPRTEPKVPFRVKLNSEPKFDSGANVPANDACPSQTFSSMPLISCGTMMVSNGPSPQSRPQVQPGRTYVRLSLAS
jgi:hypothetical protein